MHSPTPLQELAALTRMRPKPPEQLDWTVVREELGFDPPADYRLLVDHYGSGVFDYYLQVHGPDDHLYVLGDNEDWDEILKEDWKYNPETAPKRAGARDAKVVRWAGSEDAHILFWLVEPDRDAGEWLIGLQGHDGPECEYFEMSTVEFLLAYVRSELESELLRPFDDGRTITFQSWSEIRSPAEPS